MTGIDQSSLGRSLKSAEAVSPLPCARTLLVHGFSPDDVSTWGDTGGIPEEVAPFILEHYGINAASPSPQARAPERVGRSLFFERRRRLIKWIEACSLRI